MALHDFILPLIEKMLADEDLSLSEQDIRFYGEGTTAEADENLDDHIRWRNARYYNENSNVIRSSILMVQLTFSHGAEFVNFHVGELYRLYRKDGMKGLYTVVKNDIMQVRAAGAQSLAALNQIEDYESIKDRLIIRPLNYDNNAKVLENCIYRRTGDIALVLYLSVGRIERERGNDILTAMVRRDIFKKWEKEEQEVFDWALENTMRLQPPALYRTDLFWPEGESRRVDFMDDESVTFSFDELFAPFLSTEQLVNGAVAAFYPGVLERLYDMVGQDLYLVFTAIDEVHIHPINGKMSVGAMRKIQADTNRAINKRNELLSRKIYRYNGIKKTIIPI